MSGITSHRFNRPLLWVDYAGNWSVAPTIVATIPSGVVHEYAWDGVTRYRLVPDPYDPKLDAFYKDFSGGVLSGLIVTRG